MQVCRINEPFKNDVYLAKRQDLNRTKWSWKDFRYKIKNRDLLCTMWIY